jgi:hypothetical protein
MPDTTCINRRRIRAASIPGISPPTRPTSIRLADPSSARLFGPNLAPQLGDSIRPPAEATFFNHSDCISRFARLSIAWEFRPSPTDRPRVTLVPVPSCSCTHEIHATAFVTFRRFRPRRAARKTENKKVHYEPNPTNGHRSGGRRARALTNAKSKSRKSQHRPSPTNGQPNHRISSRSADPRPCPRALDVILLRSLPPVSRPARRRVWRNR